MGAPPRLHRPFRGSYRVTCAFGDIPDNDRIQKLYSRLELQGHNGIDWALPEGTLVRAVAGGTVGKSGMDGDFGVSVTLTHGWGTSLYAHLSSCRVTVGQRVRCGQVIGVSGATGTVTGPHLHFGIKPTVPDPGNGFHGYIDPSPFLY